VREPNTRDMKLIQYLNEAFGKEKQLETALEAHISMTSRDTYKKRLQQHLRETKGHAREVERRIKQLGGKPEAAPVHVPEALADAATRVTEVAQRGAALAQGPLHAVRGTSQEERQLKNAKDEFSDEAQEIATYTAIETLAESVGDKQTARIARSIRRQEERMASFLQRVIPQLTKAVAQAEIPAAERTTARRSTTTRRSTSRRPPTRRSTTRRTTRRTTGARRATGTRRTTASRRTTGTRKTATRRTTARRKTARASR
jgi:ferritin-like metal-binding protein YciE